MSYSKAGPDDFVPDSSRPTAPPPQSGPLAWIVLAVVLLTVGLCGGWFILAVVG